MPDRSQLPTDLKEYNRTLIAEFRANGGRLSGQRAGMKVLILTTTGARSGKPRTVVVGYRPHRGRYIVIASNNGAPSPPAWHANLRANPIAEVEVGGDKLKVRAATATPEERGELAGVVEYLDSQQKLTGREIPIVILDPAGA